MPNVTNWPKRRHWQTFDPGLIWEDADRFPEREALIVAAAVKAKAEKILTEDLSHGQRIEGVLIQNPFFDTANG
jgi:hypothetical protein